MFLPRTFFTKNNNTFKTLLSKTYVIKILEIIMQVKWMYSFWKSFPNNSFLKKRREYYWNNDLFFEPLLMMIDDEIPSWNPQCFENANNEHQKTSFPNNPFLQKILMIMKNQNCEESNSTHNWFFHHQTHEPSTKNSKISINPPA